MADQSGVTHTQNRNNCRKGNVFTFKEIWLNVICDLTTSLTFPVASSTKERKEQIAGSPSVCDHGFADRGKGAGGGSRLEQNVLPYNNTGLCDFLRFTNLTPKQHAIVIDIS